MAPAYSRDRAIYDELAQQMFADYFGVNGTLTNATPAPAADDRHHIDNATASACGSGPIFDEEKDEQGKTFAERFEATRAGWIEKPTRRFRPPQLQVNWRLYRSSHNYREVPCKGFRRL